MLERLQSTVARRLPQWMFDIRVSPSSHERIRDISRLLREHPSWNAILYFNHMAYGDPGIWGFIARTIDPDASRTAAVLASKFHTTFRNNPAFALAARVGDTLGGIHVIPTIQSYMVDNPQYGYTKRDASKNQKEILRRIHNFSRRKPIMLLISPEGHRSDDGTLGQPEKGVASFGAMLAPALLIPTGIFYEGNFRRNGINTRSRKHPVLAIAEVGEPITQESRHQRVPLELMMHHLARTLPRELRGAWRE